MYILQPISKERIWGTPRLHAFSGAPEIEKIGSVYSASGVEDLSCEVLNSEASLDIRCLIAADPAKFGLLPGEEYPLIISMTAADEHLSIQVHPTDDYAKAHEAQPYGKSEAWFFLSPPESGWIYAEQKLQNKEAIAKKIQQNQYDEVLKEYPVAQHDLIYIPSGTIHALTKGSLVYEIQQSADITYRFYDYDRTDSTGQKRPLHINAALETLMPEQTVDKDSFAIGETVTKREFAIEHKLVTGELTNPAEIAAVLTILAGSLNVSGTAVEPGQSILLLPQETIQVEGEAECVLAIPIPYWRH